MVKKLFRFLLGKYNHYKNKYYYSFLTIISPTLNTKALYKKCFHKKLNLKDPQSFNEKLLWLKLKKYNKDPLVIQCADKYKVRDYIKSNGCGEILNDLIGVYDSFDQIDWNSLPERFVLKWNFGAGFNIICQDKSLLNYQEVRKKMIKWGKTKYWLPHSEMHYKYIKKKIICERFLESKQEPGVIPDYKVYCFNGEPKAIFVMHDRGQQIKTEFFDTKWNRLDNSKKYADVVLSTPKPKCLDKMIEISKKISHPFPFVRCDFYIVDEKLYFGEMTFTPAGGLYTSQTIVDGKEMGELLNLKQFF